MDSMQVGQNNGHIFKDTSLSLKDTSIFISYTKSNKLLTATYMVTDILPTSEPIRSQIRALVVEIVSDINHLTSDNFATMSVNVLKNTALVISLLDVLSVLNMISKMNHSILKKEFEELYNSVVSVDSDSVLWSGASSLSDFFLAPSILDNNIQKDTQNTSKILDKGHRDNYKGHISQNSPIARIGVQKGSTLLKALSDKVINKNEVKADFDFIKKERRFEIIESIKNFLSKNSPDTGATIKDILDNARGTLKITSEKTLQRELIAMVSDDVLYKEGSKRWSKYFIKK